MGMNNSQVLKKEALDMLESKAITDRESFLESVELLMRVQEKVEKLKLGISEFALLQKQLNKAVCDYADAHPEAMDTRSIQTGRFAYRSSVSINGSDYFYCIGKGKVKRSDGSNMVREFIESMPKKWWTSKPELNEKYVIEHASEQELREHNFCIEPNRYWRKGM